VEEQTYKSRVQRDNEDVVVVGSSAAGLYTAACVARGGRRVSVLEAKPTPDPAPRTLIVTDYFKNQISNSARSSILNEIRRFELFTDGRSAQIALSDYRTFPPDSHAGRRSLAGGRQAALRHEISRALA